MNAHPAAQWVTVADMGYHGEDTHQSEARSGWRSEDSRTQEQIFSSPQEDRESERVITFGIRVDG